MKQIGATLVVLYNQGREFKHKEQVFGELIMETDTQTHFLSPGLDILTNFFTAQAAQNLLDPHKVLIISPSMTALRRMLDMSMHGEQQAAIAHLNKLGEILWNHPVPNIKLLFLPRNIPFIGFRQAKQLAMEAIHMANLNKIVEPQTIRSQITRTNEEAINNWAECWHQNHHTLLAYHTALTKLLDSRPHPTFQHGRAQRKAGARCPSQHPTLNQEAKSGFSCRMICTLYRIITGHTFTGEYAQHFCPQHTPDQVACPCGEWTQAHPNGLPTI